ncbi:hypothetical protein SRRS_34310 [Sporomusa rhizae]|uniref:acetamidase/formamidase family protein n=1 Tax=Sporomusa rhizae TaxID=357999 RepID=UPI00352A3B76
MKRISRNESVLYLSNDIQPVMTVLSGETVIFETVDCYNEQITSNMTLFCDIKKEVNNPATGPLYIEGAEPGDILKIDILDIKVNKWGVMTARPGDGVLKDFFTEYKSKVIPIEEEIAKFNEKVSFPIQPMVGVIGVAPAGEPIKTTIPGFHGGNLDCKKIAKDSSVYLPVFVPGGLLCLGDLHAVMADGEVVICGLETGGEVTVRATVIKGHNLSLPLVVTPDTINTIASCKTLDEAALLATTDMQRVLTQQAGVDPYDAAMLLSLAGELGICQVVNSLKTCRMELPLRVLEAYGYELPK